MLDDTGSAKRQPRNQESVKNGVDSPRSQSQLKTPSPAHYCYVVQGLAHCDVSVIGHCGKKKTFHPSKGNEEIDLSNAFCKGNDVLVKQSGKKAWKHRRDQTLVYKGEIAEEKVHWLVQLRTGHRHRKQQTIAPK